MPASVEMDPRTRLKLAADLLERSGWCQGSYARDKNERHVPWHAPEAVTFCAVGALMRVSLDGKEDVLLARRAPTTSYSEMHFLTVMSKPLISMNDELDMTKEKMVRAMRRASRRTGNWFIDLFIW